MNLRLHNSFSKIVNCAHPSLLRFIKFLQINEGYHLLAVQQFNQGQTLRIQKRKYLEFTRES
ncbi:hypothetical protein HZS_2451 [Henneguya salminicola]|nr:hypothetical protein HZS_2451 [Henneguya salminicola]